MTVKKYIFKRKTNYFLPKLSILHLATKNIPTLLLVTKKKKERMIKKYCSSYFEIFYGTLLEIYKIRKLI